MASERTAAQFGLQGEVRRDPMAMLPFCGYNMGDYFQHWLNIGERSSAEKLPKIFYVNWFRKSPEGRFLWPGYGENSRVLAWVINRVAGKAEARETPIGYVPTPEAIDTSGLDIPADSMKSLLAVDPEEWRAELPLIKEHFEQFGERLPAALWEEYRALAQRLDGAAGAAG